MLAAMPKMILIEVILTTGEKISSKSIPSFCPKPFTTKRALNFVNCSFSSLFNLNTHLFLSAFLPLGSSTNS
ncbi:hypothetical protein RchiOBHm_Chr3g0467321 [Rosa chinensis]|uniref:Uncharacterized protein n=1 Tax=Rosa chinensis TaxID=74649 RepID=A0A2P6RA74_ROSCH|nr:hypothetical protein RchiOBHm_Chr3g0467321 [Rosa chinensis]